MAEQESQITRPGPGWGPQPSPGPVRPEADEKPKKSGLSARLAVITGNLLIVIGAVVLLSVGAFYAYAEYKEAELTKRIEAQNEGTDELGYLPILNDGAGTAESASRAGAGDAESISGFIPPSEPVAPTPAATGEDDNSSSVATATPELEPKPPAKRIVIPKIGVDSQVVEVGSTVKEIAGEEWLVWDVASFAVGHHEGSANPGEPGNIVMTGHDDIDGEVFRYLENLQPGDQITLHTDEGEHLYVIKRLELVREKDASPEERRQNALFMAPTTDETLTLISCWPYKIDTHRIIVIAKPYETAPGGQLPDSNAR